MKNPFRPSGFDSVIGKGTHIHGPMSVTGTMVIDGEITQGTINGSGEVITSTPRVIVNGRATVSEINMFDLTISGQVAATSVRVEGTLAVKGGAQLIADTIYYRTLIVEPDAIIQGKMMHLDHVSEGEQT